MINFCWWRRYRDRSAHFIEDWYDSSNDWHASSFIEWSRSLYRRTDTASRVRFTWFIDWSTDFIEDWHVSSNDWHVSLTDHRMINSFYIERLTRILSKAQHIYIDWLMISQGRSLRIFGQEVGGRYKSLSLTSLSLATISLSKLCLSMLLVPSLPSPALGGLFASCSFSVVTSFSASVALCNRYMATHQCIARR